VRTFDELIHTALVDIAKQAEPADLVDAALDDIPRRTRALALGAVAAATFTLAAGLVVGFAADQDVPQGRFQPNRVVPGQSGSGSPSDCGTPAPGSDCANPEANATLSASESPSAGPSASPSRRPTPEATSPTTTSTDSGPGNRPRPKPSKPGRAR
jgi:hypothetical protein